MPGRFNSISLTCAAGLVLAASPLVSVAQGASSGLEATAPAAIAAYAIPDAPTPQIEMAAADEAQAAQGQGDPPPDPSAATASIGYTQSGSGQNSTGQGNSSSQQPTSQPGAEESQHQKAEQQLRAEEHQRIAGIVPSFNVSYLSDAVSLTPAEKFELEFRSAIDPYTFTIAAIVAGLGEAEDSNNGLGWGPGGYAERAAAAYGDNVIGNTIGNAILPSILHQDPRFFRLGHGSVGHRFLYAFATSFICKHDNTGKWEPNYSNVLGNMIAGEISTLYYPNSKGDATQAIETGLTVTFEGTFGASLQEFWPDISRKFFHKDPTHGLDVQ